MGDWWGKNQDEVNMQSRQAIVDPGVSDDITEGFVVNSLWTNTVTKANYVCVDSTIGAAVWKVTTEGGTGVYDSLIVNDTIGIGVTPEAWVTYKALQVNATSSISAAPGTLFNSENAYYDGAWKYINTSQASQISSGAGTHTLSVAVSGTEDTAITWIDALFINSSGDIGVGTTNPLKKFQITEEGVATLRLDDVTNISHCDIVGGGSTGSLTLRADEGDAKGSSTIRFDIDGGEIAQFDSSGNFGIGTTSPAEKLELSSATGTASPVSTTMRISTTSSGSDWSTTLPWGKVAFYNADGSGGGPKEHAAMEAIASGATGSSSNLVFKTNVGGSDTLTTALTIDAVQNATFANDVTIGGDTLNIATQKTPATAAATGVKGDIVHDTGFIYVCTATDTWKRVAIATW